MSGENEKQSIIMQLIIAAIVAVSVFFFFATTSVPETSRPAPPPPNPAADLQIQEGWTWELSRSNNYSYIKGSVKNIGSKPISYFEVRAEYLDDKGNILDTSYTNSGERINPGAQKRFEIMHKHSSDFVKARINIGKVSYAKQ